MHCGQHFYTKTLVYIFGVAMCLRLSQYSTRPFFAFSSEKHLLNWTRTNALWVRLERPQPFALESALSDSERNSKKVWESKKLFFFPVSSLLSLLFCSCQFQTKSPLPIALTRISFVVVLFAVVVTVVGCKSLKVLFYPSFYPFVLLLFALLFVREERICVP